MIKLLVALLAMSLGCGSSGSPSASATLPAPTAPAPPVTPPSVDGQGRIDLSSADAALRSLYLAVEADDYDAVVRILDAPAEAKQEIAMELRRERDEILECLENARVGELQPDPDHPNHFRMRLEGCPTKQGYFCCAVDKHDDGTWTIADM